MANSDRYEDDDDLGFDLDVVGILRRRYHLIALGVFVGASLATLFYVKQVPVYESHLAVLVGHRNADTATDRGGSFMEGASIQDEILSTHIELFTSRKILERAIADGRLPRSVGELAGSLSVSKGGRGQSASASMLRASYRDTDPEIAARAVQAIYDSYQSYIVDKTQNVGAEAAELISQSQQRNEQLLREADQEYRDFLQSMPALVSVSQDGGARIDDVHRTRLSAIENELATIRSAMASLVNSRNDVRSMVQGRKPEEISVGEALQVISDEEIGRLQTIVSFSRKDASITAGGISEDVAIAQAINRGSAQTEFSRLLDLSSRRSVLVQQFGEGHPAVESIDVEIANLQEYVNNARTEIEESEAAVVEARSLFDSLEMSPSQVLQNYYSDLTAELTRYKQRESDLAKQAEEESRLAKEVQMNFMLGNALKAKLDRAQNRYDEVFKRVQEIKLSNDYSGFSSDLIVTPVPSGTPVSPVKSKVASMGLMGGLMLGAALAMLAETLDRTFKNPEDVERAIGAQILSHLPHLDKAKAAKAAKEGSAISPMIATFHKPRGTDAETYRVLRTSVLFFSKSENKKVFQITSPSPSDGKSTTFANLAVSLAQTGRRVLLVDGDMRRPTVHETFGVDRKPGLSDFLTGDAEFENVYRQSEQENLWICPEGSRTSSPSELLESTAFGDFVMAARDAFDLVLIDAPPVLAVADPVIIAGHVDSILLGVRIEKNNSTLVQRAAEILRDQAHQVDGILVNSSGQRFGSYGYSSYNYYSKKEYGYQKKYRSYYAASDEEVVRDSETPNPAASAEPSGGSKRQLDQRNSVATNQNHSGSADRAKPADRVESANRLESANQPDLAAQALIENDSNHSGLNGHRGTPAGKTVVGNEDAAHHPNHDAEQNRVNGSATGAVQIKRAPPTKPGPPVVTDRPPVDPSPGRSEVSS